MKYLLMALTMVSFVSCTSDDLSSSMKQQFTDGLTKGISKSYGKSKFSDSFSAYIVDNTSVKQLSINEQKTEAEFEVSTLNKEVIQGIGTIAALGGASKDSTVDDILNKMNEKQKRQIASAKRNVMKMKCPLVQKDSQLSVDIQKCKE